MPSFISRWQASAAAERSNFQAFALELCDFLNVPRPDPTTADHKSNTYVFEHPVTFHHPNGTESTGRIDLYKRAHFVLEAKQGSEATPATTLFDLPRRRGTNAWDEAMAKARNQAEQYAKALPDEWPLSEPTTLPSVGSRRS